MTDGRQFHNSLYT